MAKSPSAAAKSPAAREQTVPSGAPAGGEPAAAVPAGGATPLKAPSVPLVEEPPAQQSDARAVAILVRSVSSAGRRRGGIAFGPAPARLLLDDLGVEQLQAIAEDPELIVEAGD